MSGQPGKLRIAVVFGGRSAEHPISCVSAGAVLAELDPDRYDVVRWELAAGDEQRDGEREVESGADLAQVRRREVDGDALQRKVESGVNRSEEHTSELQ